jgi:hypothetical protein
MNALQQLKTNGWCVLKNIIPEPKVHTVRDSVLQTVAQHRRDSAADSIGFVPGLIAHNQSFAPYLADARLMSICETLLGHDIRISFTSAIVNEPGNARGKWHADWPSSSSTAECGTAQPLIAQKNPALPSPFVTPPGGSTSTSSRPTLTDGNARSQNPTAPTMKSLQSRAQFTKPCQKIFAAFTVIG